MRISYKFFAGGIAVVALIGAAGGALASHGKAGLWSITVTMGGDMPNMPDMSKMPPEVQARMRAMGMSGNGHTMTVQHCMTVQEVAMDTPHMDPHSSKECKMSNMKIAGHSMSADMTCSGEMQGTGHMQFTYDSDTHYIGEVKITGMADGHPIDHDQKFEGKWLSADCGAVSH